MGQKRRARAEPRRKDGSAGIKPPSGAVTLWAIVLFVLAFLVYSNTLGHGFVFDDASLISQSKPVRELEWGNILSINGYRPVRTFTYALNYALGGDDPFGYHLFNVVFHAVNAILVFLLLWRWLIPVPAAWLGGLFFAVHPVQTAAVAYVSGRKDILATTFVLLGCHSYTSLKRMLRNKARPSLQKRAGMGMLTLALFLLAVLAKEVAIVFPALLLLLDVTVLSREDQDPRKQRTGLLSCLIDVFRRSPVLYGVSLVLLLVTGYYAVFITEASRMKGFWGGDPIAHYGTTFKLFLHYVKLVFVPYPLIADYTGQVFRISKGFAEPATIGSIAFMVAYVFLALRIYRQNLLLALGMLWFLVTLSPVLQLIPFHELAADHFLYLPLFGLVVIFAEAVNFLKNRWNTKAVFAGAVALLILYAALAIDRNRDWKDEFTLWSATYKVAPGSHRANVNLALFYSQRGQVEKAIQYTMRSIDLDPTREQAWSNLGGLYRVQAAKAREQKNFGKAQELNDKAIHYLERALEMNPRDVWAFANLGQVYRELGLVMEARGKATEVLELRKQAVRHYQTALRIGSDNPYFHIIWFEMGKVFMDAGYYDQAIFYLNKAAAAYPRRLDILCQIGVCYFNLRRYAEAIRYLDRVAEESDSVTVWGMLAKSYEEMGDNRGAIATYQRASHYFPRSVEIHYNLGVLYHRVGEPRLAVRRLKQALDLDPDGPLSGNIRQMLAVIGDTLPAS